LNSGNRIIFCINATCGDVKEIYSKNSEELGEISFQASQDGAPILPLSPQAFVAARV
jgi:hypothetical protein